MYMLGVFALLVIAAIANILGAPGVGLLGAREGTWLLTLALFGAMLAVAGFAVCSRWDGIFIDRDNRISLSRLQLVLWTALIVSALFTGGLTNMTSGSDTPLLIKVPPEIWALLGLSGFTAVAAPAIKEGQKRVQFRAPDTSKRSAGQNVAAMAGATFVAGEVKTDQGLSGDVWYVNRVLVKEDPKDARWIDLINGDYEGAAWVDVSKLQQLVFTAMLVITYGSATWLLMGKAAFTTFPPLYPAFVGLLGISHATYLADKQIGST